ncbi:hypothetical protein ALC57_18475 [Trachymyrmex cornetzi]|uniref:Uncharacterized protein n=1 Tax=Trachymyrmex cornetzi TaxID=471704 RepID=A0A151IRR9_9HYME|nr:hypothetical protein ALC57_18475 [Trachymyrmex cornetzi]
MFNDVHAFTFNNFKIISRSCINEFTFHTSEWIAAMNLIIKEETIYFSFTCHPLAVEDFFRAAEVDWAFQQLELVLVDRLP